MYLEPHVLERLRAYKAALAAQDRRLTTAEVLFRAWDHAQQTGYLTVLGTEEEVPSDTLFPRSAAPPRAQRGVTTPVYVSIGSPRHLATIDRLVTEAGGGGRDRSAYCARVLDAFLPELE